MRVLMLESVHEEAQARLEAAVEPVRASALDAATVAREATGCGAIIMRGAGRIPGAVLEANPGLRCVARCGVGLDNIDVAAATRLGVPVVHAPDSSTQSVAEHALSLALALARQVGRLDRAVKAGNWGVREGFRGRELAGKTLGVIGLGRIGRRTAALAKALGMGVVTWSPRQRDERFSSLPLEELLATADVVSLHLALTPETRGLIDGAALHRMKPGAILINTARGALVDETALAEALAAGHLGGVGVDVLIDEPPAADHPLLRCENVLITPHTAGLTDTAYRQMCVETVEQVLLILAGQAPNPGNVFNHAALRATRSESSVVSGTDVGPDSSALLHDVTPAAQGRGTGIDYQRMLQVAVEEARAGMAEGGIPIGAALFDREGTVLGRGHNRRVQEQDPSVHGETDAFRKAGRQRGYRDKIMVTTLAPCWYCSGLVRQFNIGTVVVGESVNFRGGIDWLREHGVEVIDLNSSECIRMLADYIAANPEIWNEDIGAE